MKFIPLLIIIIPSLLFIIKPVIVINIYSKWYSLFGMKVDRNNWLWKEKTIQITGFFMITSSIIITLLSKNWTEIKHRTIRSTWYSRTSSTGDLGRSVGIMKNNFRAKRILKSNSLYSWNHTIKLSKCELSISPEVNANFASNTIPSICEISK